MIDCSKAVGEIIDQVRSRYCLCKSYKDEGFAEMRRCNKLEGLVEFKTYYKQPNQFRFDFKRNAPMGTLASASIRRNRNQCISHSPDLPELMDIGDLNTAMAGATGISLGVTLFIPALLMAQIRCHRLIDYADYDLIEFDPSVPDDHFALDANEEGTHLRLLIRKNDFCISEIRKETQQSEEDIETLLQKVPKELQDVLTSQMQKETLKKELSKPVEIVYRYSKIHFDLDIAEETFDLRRFQN